MRASGERVLGCLAGWSAPSGWPSVGGGFSVPTECAVQENRLLLVRVRSARGPRDAGKAVFATDRGCCMSPVGPNGAARRRPQPAGPPSELATCGDTNTQVPYHLPDPPASVSVAYNIPNRWQNSVFGCRWRAARAKGGVFAAPEVCGRSVWRGSWEGRLADGVPDRLECCGVARWRKRARLSRGSVVGCRLCSHLLFAPASGRDLPELCVP